MAFLRVPLRPSIVSFLFFLVFSISHSVHYIKHCISLFFLVVFPLEGHQRPRIYGTYITDFLKLSTCMVFELQFNLKEKQNV